MCHAMPFFFSNSSALAFPDGFFHGCIIANANVYALPQNDSNSACVTILVTLSKKPLFLSVDIVVKKNKQIECRVCTLN